MTVKVTTPNQTKFLELPEILLGQSADDRLIFQTFWTAVAHALLQIIHESFVAKSEGGTDRFGERWKPLSKRTIMSRPVPGQKDGQFGLLTEKQHRQWKGIFASTFERKAKSMSATEARKEAAKLAWGILKARGARLKSEVLNSQNVLILVLTERLKNSLTPGPFKVPYQKMTADQILSVTKAGVKIGTNVPYADEVSRVRPVIPTSILDVLDEAVEAGFREIEHLVRDQYGRNPTSS